MKFTILSITLMLFDQLFGVYGRSMTMAATTGMIGASAGGDISTHDADISLIAPGASSMAATDSAQRDGDAEVTLYTYGTQQAGLDGDWI
eukprot:CFRG5981T1